MGILKTQKKADPGRLASQETLRSVDALREDYRRACEGVEAARVAVYEGHKAPAYIERAEEKATAIARKIDYIRNNVPQQLRQSCKDEALRLKAEKLQRESFRAQQALTDADSELDQAKSLWRQAVDNLRARYGEYGDGWQPVNEDSATTVFSEFKVLKNSAGLEGAIAENAKEIATAARQYRVAAELHREAAAEKARVVKAIEDVREALTWSPV